MRAVAVALLALSATVLAACVGEPEPASAATPAASDLATINGFVVSDEVFPVEGANVTIEVGGPSTFTGAEGGFSFTDLDPGRYRLNASADGYAPASHEVSVGAGQVVDVLITLVAVAGDAPYLSTIIYEGFVACTWSAVYSTGQAPGPCPFGPPATMTSMNVSEGWAAGVHELMWQTQEELIMASSLTDGCGTTGAETDPCPFLGWGRAPLRAFARPDDARYAARYALDGKATWPEEAHESHILISYSGYLRSEVNATAYPVCAEINRAGNAPPEWGCPFGFGVSTGLRATVYHTTFYHQEPADLQAFTAIPDQ